MFHADLHIHSRFSRACSRDCDLEHLAWWARRKGITVVGTGDFTHPGWADELKESLIPAEPGLFRLRQEAEDELSRSTPASCRTEVRFMLSTEISTIYRGGDRTRKVHHLLYAPTFEAADRITRALAKIGNLASDGRPILGLDSRHLLEITLDGGPGCYLIPAHAWTPWFAVLGSKSGFDVVADCYGDLAGEVFAIETGLSSDPPMNWRCSSLDGYRLVSNSDAHSPPMLGREATTFDVRLDYFAMAGALRTGDGLAGTIEFYPEEGKYHLDGHRKCGVRFEPAQSREHEGACPECGKPLTIGVLHRVTELADRPVGFRPPGAPGFTNLVQLPQIVGEIMAAGPKSKKVGHEVGRLVATLGPELGILTEADPDDLRRAGGSLLAEAVSRLRRGEVRREAGFDGEYGVVALFGPGELDGTDALFDLAIPRRPSKEPAESAGNQAAIPAAGPAPAGQKKPRPRRKSPATRWGGGADPGTGTGPGGGPDLGTGTGPGGGPDLGTGTGPGGGPDLGTGTGPGGDLDPDQLAAVGAGGPLMIIAGPGTGKTRTLTHRIARQLASSEPTPQPCLAVTFTRRAAEEMRSRLAALLPAGQLSGNTPDVTVTTCHGLGLMILREHHELAGLNAGFRVADEAERLEVAAGLAGSDRDGKRLLAEAATDPAARELLVKALTTRDLVDFDGLIELPAALLAAEPAVAESLRERWPRISVDEYQDIDAAQYRLLRLLAGDGRGLTVIGDPDQAIYGFRGADVGLFLRFGRDYPGAVTQELTWNYRSGRAVVTGALQAIAPSSLVPGRILQPAEHRAPQAAPAAALIGFHEAGDERGEAAWIAREIERLLGGASFHALDTGRAGAQGHDGLGLSDVAVLYRTDAQAEPLGQALIRAGLPFQKSSHDLLERRTGVPGIVREMRLASAGSEAVADGLRRAVRTLAARADDPAAAIDVRAAGEVLAPLARRCGSDLERFLTEISLGAETDALDPRADAVTLLTLHAAKGLEFEVVFLAGCEQDLLPLRLPGHPPVTGPELAEERRLLFVGMTRARARLYLTCASRRSRHGSTRETGPSPFLAAIDAALLDRSEAASRPSRPASRQLRLL
jgi:DNA helicase II / ATP-dependent DNA helicase PcrA